MRKILLVAIFLCVPIATYALGVNGTGTTEKGKFAIGLEGEYIFERDMDGSTVDTSSIPGSPNTMRVYVEAKDMSRSLLNLSYGLTDNISIYLKVGAADWESEADVYSQTLGPGRIGHVELDADMEVAYGGGIRIELPLSQDDNPIVLGVDGQYLRHENDVDGRETFTFGPPPANLDGKFEVQEWQIAGYFAKSFGDFTPYIGVKASNLNMDGHIQYTTIFNPFSVSYTGDSKYNFGGFVGANLNIGDAWALGVEGRFVDETAISGKCVFKF